MKRAIILGVGAFALAAMTLPAAAADLRPVTKAPPAALPPALNWSGFYVGVGLGGRWAENDWTTTCLQPVTFNPTCTPASSAFPLQFATANPTTFDPSGFRVSGYLGYNWQIGTWVLGLEGDFAWADTEQTRRGIPGTFLAANLAALTDTATVNDKWDASIRGRVGFLVAPSALIYATGGITWLEKEVSATCTAPFFPVGWCVANNFQTASKTLTGWTVGAGVEWMFLPNWILRAEYRYSEYDSTSFQFFANVPIDSFNFTVDAITHTAYAGIAYKF